MNLLPDPGFMLVATLPLVVIILWTKFSPDPDRVPGTIRMTRTKLWQIGFTTTCTTLLILWTLNRY